LRGFVMQEVKAKGRYQISRCHESPRRKFEANPLTMKIFGGVGRGSVKGVMSGESLSSW
jgi:hypothetical protein